MASTRARPPQAARRREAGRRPLDAEELAGYRVKQREPIAFDYNGWKITTAPPPSSGGIALAEMLQILEGYDIKTMDPAHRTHLVVEAMRRAYRDRTFFLGDPDFVQIPRRC
jgi:gamma-glutamyltranspeptidase/glutathione hydrolase